MTTDDRYFLGVPTEKASRFAAGVIVIFMILGGVLYYFAKKQPIDYMLKVGDCFIQGAIVTILFGILKTMIDKPSLRQFFGRAPLTHKVIGTEVLPAEDGKYRVAFAFDDGTEAAAVVGTKNEAEFYAVAQLDEDLPVGVHPLLLSASKADKLRQRTGRE